MEWHQHAVVQILSHLGQVWVYASHKPEFLTTSMMVFGRECPTFRDETISIASYCFEVFFSCEHGTTGVLCEFLWFFGVRLDIFLCINWVFNAFVCIIRISTTSTCSVHINWSKIKSMSLGACLGPMQEMGMNFKHPITVIRPQTLRYLVFKF